MNHLRPIFFAAPFICSLCFSAAGQRPGAPQSGNPTANPRLQTAASPAERGGRKEEAPPPRVKSARGQEDPVGKVEYFVSKMDGETRAYATCATDDLKEPKPLILLVSPGGGNAEGAVAECERYAPFLKSAGISCVFMRPTGRGNGTLYQNYGEVDLFEAVEDAMKKYPIDPDRISVFGHSMGGAATWYLASHYPDFFSAAAPMSGYCDYRLWEKPGGHTFHMNDWEEASWKARSAAFLVENLEHTPIWILHGEWDRGMGSGVSVEHAREMKRLMTEKGFPPAKYSEFPKKGHHFWTPFIDPGDQQKMTDLLVWLAEQKKDRAPKHVALATYDLRHNRSYWVAIEQVEQCGGKKALVDAAVDGGAVRVKTENVRTLSLGPIPGAKKGVLTIDATNLDNVNFARKTTFQRDAKGEWKTGPFDLAGQKRHGCAGPVADMFFEKPIFVIGTKGTDEENYLASWLANNAAQLYRSTNGGVHRGGINGDNDVTIPILKDTEVTDEDIKTSNLTLFGTYRTNAVLARFKGKLPLEFSRNAITVCGKTFIGPQAAVYAVFPNPKNPNRYIAVHGGITPDAATFGSHLNIGLLPDYLVYNGGQTLGWGFWGNDWK